MTDHASTSTKTFGETWDGVAITPGLAVFTNEIRVGIVQEADHGDGWFDVRYADGRLVMQDASRVATHFGGRKAADVLAKAEQD